MEPEREGAMDTADITRDSVDISAEPPSYAEPQLEFLQRRPLFDSISLVIQGSIEGELGLMDNLSGSICHYYALPPRPDKHSTDKKQPPKDNLLSVRKPAVGRTHSLPNDSYMFFPLQPFGPSCPSPAQLVANSQEPQHLVGTRRAQSGSRGSVRSQPEDCSQQLAVPTDFFRPISPHSHSDSESGPRQPPARRTHALSRTLRRQVAVSTDSQEALCSDERESIEGLLNVAALGLPPSTCPSSSSSHYHHHLHPALYLVPETPAISPKPNSVHTQQHDQHCLPSYSSSALSSSSSHLPPPPLPARSQQQQQEEQEEEEEEEATAASEDQEVSLIICGGLVTSDSIAVENTGSQESQSPFVRQLKRFHSVDTQGRSTLHPRPRPYSWLDDPRRHSVEVYSAEDACTQCITASTSTGCVSRSDSLQIPPQPPLPSPRRKKKMSPPCISVDPPDELEPQSGLYPSLSGMGLGGFGMPPPLPSRDTCLRRRAPSSDSKDSFDLGAGEGSGQDGGSPNPSSKLLTLPSFSFEKTNSEH